MERIRAHWSSWLLQGIPAAVVVLGAVLSLGRTIGSHEIRLSDLENDRAKTALQMETLTLKIDEMNLKLQQLQDRLETKGDISYPPAKKHSVQFQQDSRDVSGSGAPHY